jgi:O-succinylbenzoic acid--CoA ligase
VSAPPAWIEARAALAPDAPALLWRGATLCFGELAERARGLARGLHALGVREGDRVAALLGNQPDFVALFHAASLSGAVLVPLDTRHSAVEVGHALADSAARLLVRSETARASVEPAPGLACVTPNALAAAGASAPPCEAVRPELARPLAILHTSGTSGRPKGAVLTHASFWWSAVLSAAHLGAPPGERWLACMPLHHVGGLAILARAAIFGAAVVLHERFDAAAVGDSLERDGATIASFVPTMLRRVLAARSAPPPPSLRCVLVGGAALPPDLLAEAWRRGWPAAPTYGLTEACSQVATLPLSEIGRRTDGAARPLFGVELEIRDAAGRRLPPGEPGEIAVRSPALMAGYHAQPEATARVLRDGWLLTGDVGVLDAQGWLRVLDRRDDLVVTGGENVYPAEVEAALESHAAVAEAAVAAEPDPDLGRRVAAWIVPAAGSAVDEDALRAHCRARLAGYKVPRVFHTVASLPRTASGKLRRQELAGARE